MARVPEIIRRNPVSQVAARPAQSGQGFTALAQLAQMGEDFIRPAARDQARVAGEKSVYRDENGVLMAQERSVLGGEMAAVHNSAAYAKYLSQKQIDMGETFTELARSYEFDPAGFQKASKAYVDILRADENVPSVLKEGVIASAEQESMRRFNGLQNTQIDRNYKEANRDTNTARDMLVDDYVALFTAGDMEAAESKWAEIQGISQFRSDAPYISETPAETEAYLQGARGAAKAGALIRELENLEGSVEITDEKRAEILAVLEDEDISAQARMKLYTATHGRLKGIDAAAIVGNLTDNSFWGALTRAESGGDPNAQNPNSTASGLYQLLDGTFVGQVKELRKVGQADWAKGLSDAEILAQKGNQEFERAAAENLRRANVAGLENAGLPVNDGTEYMAWFLGAGGAVEVLRSDPNTLISDIVSDAVMKANPFLANMTVSGMQNWANRKMTTKASDIALQQVSIDQIEDTEVRSMAGSVLNERYGVQKRMEDAAAIGYSERLAANDDTLTEQEILEDHSISDSTQSSLVSKLRTLRKDAIAIQQTVADLNDETVIFDPYDSNQRNAVDDAFKASLDGADPLTDPSAQVSAAEIAIRTGYVPKTMFNALRAATLSGDPARVAVAMEFTQRVLDEQPNALGPYGGKTDITKALSDYRFYAEFGSAEEAAARLIELNDPVNKASRKNLSDAAKAAAERLAIGDIADHFDNSIWSSVDTGSVIEEDSIMAEYSRLFTDEFVDTGDVALAKNRALDQMGRIYGPNAITGSNRVMKFPPQNFYPAVNGSQDWMGEQLEAEVSALVFGDEASPAVFGDFSAITGDAKWIQASSVKLVSDPTTRAQIMRGEAPSYMLYYMQDGILTPAQQRFAFDPAQVEVKRGAEAIAEEDRQHDIAVNTQRLEALQNEFGTSEGTRRYLEELDAIR